MHDMECMQIENMKNTHPGAKEELEEKGLSVCRNSLNVRQSIDGAGEQTFMKSAKQREESRIL